MMNADGQTNGSTADAGGSATGAAKVKAAKAKLAKGAKKAKPAKVAKAKKAAAPKGSVPNGKGDTMKFQGNGPTSWKKDLLSLGGKDSTLGKVVTACIAAGLANKSAVKKALVAAD